MQYITQYQSPLGRILLAADEAGLTGLWFHGQKYYANGLLPEATECMLPIFEETKRWLTVYFSGQEPDFTPPLHAIGSAFRVAVWEILQQIPYGETTTYGEIARQIAAGRGCSGLSAQAVGSAVGHNPISILIPCHRVVGANGSLTGYAGGLERKHKLLTLEGAATEKLFVPRHGTAL